MREMKITEKTIPVKNSSEYLEMWVALTDAERLEYKVKQRAKFEEEAATVASIIMPKCRCCRFSITCQKNTQPN